MSRRNRRKTRPTASPITRADLARAMGVGQFARKKKPIRNLDTHLTMPTATDIAPAPALPAPRLATPTPKREHRIMLGIPSLGHYHCDMALSLISCSKNHMVDVQKASSNWDNFSILWATALNAAESGHISHFAMLHDDVIPLPFWIDTLVSEMERMQVPLISVPCPIKDHNGITSSGIGQTADPYRIWRRLTLWELYHTSLPETFTLADVMRCLPGRWPEGESQPYLCHNNACWVADLRDPRWHEADPDGTAKIYFRFPKRMFRIVANEQDFTKGEYTEAGAVAAAQGVRWMVTGESEDWFFSRKVHESGIPSCITTKVKLGHDGGSVRWTNDDGWGAQQHDEATRGQWGADLPDPPGTVMAVDGNSAKLVPE